MRQKEYRLENGISVRDMAEILEITQSALYRYERGHMPEPSILSKIYTFTGGKVTPNDYFFQGRRG